MKIGVISDIHGNLQALQAVLKKLDEEKCIKIVCAGDVVGYGANPSQCVELVRQRHIACVRGNHDHMVAHPGRELGLRAQVRQAIQWTRTNLSDEDIKWLGSLPFENNFAGLNLIHASHVFRPEWHYVVDERSICANFLFQTSAISFNGHTHLPLLAIHSRGHRPVIIRLQEFNLAKENRYLINVGSVGQPRDRIPEAACATFETRSRQVALHRVEYDIKAAQEAISNAGLPPFFSARLAEGK